MPPKADPSKSNAPSKELSGKAAASTANNNSNNKKSAVPGASSTTGLVRGLAEDVSNMTLSNNNNGAASAGSGGMPTVSRAKKGTMAARAAIEDAQIMGMDNMDDYETSKASLRGRKAVMEDDRRAVLDLERWDGPQPSDTADDF
jgi:hypothetical protein